MPNFSISRICGIFIIQLCLTYTQLWAQPEKTVSETEKKSTETKDVPGSQTEQLPEAKENPLLLRAEEYFFKERYHISLRLLKKVLEDDPENARAYLYAGDIYLIQQNYGLAEEHFQIALELTENPAREWFRLGQVRLLRKNAIGALDAFEKSLKADPTLHINLFYRGLVYYHLLQKKTETIQNWQKFRKQVPDATQGPQIDRAIAILQKSDFKFPERSDDPCIQLPTGKETKVPYKPGEDAKQKTNDTGAEPIDIEDL